ncbi:hypothetical protein [Amycolatopsis regifaucium]|uniref:Excalibur calcium-binding domain-containing protein n=1 Tax=Amycolatopsis regifaucium TaxID=546365 RepID=A0A154M4S6_9PSEU|nr:hypothetical protein [Amycolatopsis regifaucium]KZB79367.1 hypothetical protein AVL48_17430 [Amycolatopsis regifaucium]OKA07550.1 hypothetical protein ATP06_0217115 [Amycolatopsis regifaucium]SFH08554.1 hypothetical protein SAMN04489731_102390 [Amycolatopsis regifaucium]
MNRKIAALLVSAGAAVSAGGLGGCGTPTVGTPVTVVRELAPPSTTTAVVVAPPPPTSVVVVEPPMTVTRTPAVQRLTSCQRLLSEGYSFEYAFNAWVAAGRPLSWDADRDGYPCEQSYGNRN